jgi:hypothetical protein
MVNPNPKPPFPGGEYTHITDPGPQYVPPGIPRVNLVPVGDRPGQLPPPVELPLKRKPHLPAAEELVRLPPPLRAVFAGRCAARVVPLVGELLPGHDSDDPAVVAEVAASAGVAILRARSDPRDLRVIRLDYEWLLGLYEDDGWEPADGLPTDVPLWPPGRTPKWAREKESREPGAAAGQPPTDAA